MRELKFRAWDRVKRKMLYGVSPFNAHITDENEPLLSLEYSEHDDCEFMQYTGLKDKNGKEIYEWDIVQRGKNQMAIVKWSQSNARFNAINVESRRLMSFDNWTATHEMAILGNVRENPELLEEEE